MLKPITIVVDEYPGWETSISPWRLTVDGKSRSPMTADEIRSNVDMILELRVN